MKKSQLKSRKTGWAYKKRKGQANKTGQKEGKSPKKRKGAPHPGSNSRTYVYVVYTIQRYLYDMMPGTWYPKVAYIFRSGESGYMLSWHVRRTRQYTGYARCTQTATYSRRNKTYGSPLGWLWIASQQYSSHRHKVLYEFKCTAVFVQTACNSFCGARAAYALILKRTRYFVVNTYRIRLYLYSDTGKCRQLHSGTTLTAVED